jgi:hypothetical protein
MVLVCVHAAEVGGGGGGGFYIQICVNLILVHIHPNLHEAQIELVVPVVYVFIWNIVVIHVL